MADFIDLSVAIRSICKIEELGADERDHPGVYRVPVPKGLSEETMVSSALDAIFDHLSMSTPADGSDFMVKADSYDFIVFDPLTQRVLTRDDQLDCENGAWLSQYVQRLPMEMPSFFNVRVSATGENVATGVGWVIVAAGSDEDACQIAVDLLGTPRLRADGFTLKATAEKLYTSSDDTVCSGGADISAGTLTHVIEVEVVTNKVTQVSLEVPDHLEPYSQEFDEFVTERVYEKAKAMPGVSVDVSSDWTYEATKGAA